MIKVLRQKDWADPVRPATREIRSALPIVATGAPLLFVGRPAEWYAEAWLDRAAERGWAAHALSPRPGRFVGLREQAHDIVQAAVSLPTQAVLIGHGAAARALGVALTRYPAKAGVFIAPTGVAKAGESVAGAPPILLLGAMGGDLEKAGQRYGVTPTLLSDTSRLRDPSWLDPLEGILDWLGA